MVQYKANAAKRPKYCVKDETGQAGQRLLAIQLVRKAAPPYGGMRAVYDEKAECKRLDRKIEGEAPKPVAVMLVRRPPV